MGCLSDFDWFHVVWLVVLAIAAILCTLGLTSPDWVEPSTNPLERSCGPISFCIAPDTCGRYGDNIGDQQNVWWRWTIGFIGVGLALVWLCVVGAVVTMCAQSFQPIVHNVASLGGVLMLVGLILFAVGLKNTKPDGVFPCNFCGASTSAFQLENCTLGVGMIYMIVGVVVECIAGCFGYAVNHRANAPPAYRERKWTGRKRDGLHA